MVMQVMNLQRLNELYTDSRLADASEIESLRQLTMDFPYFARPYEILSKVYYETGHYRFEEMLRQAAMRVKNRRDLYAYIHGQSAVEAIEKTELPIESAQVNEEIETKEKPKLEDFLGEDLITETSENEVEPIEELEETLLETPVEPVVEIPEEESKETESIEEPKEEIEFEFEGHFKQHETVETPPTINEDIIAEEIAAEFSFSKSFVLEAEEAMQEAAANASDEEEVPEVLEETEEKALENSAELEVEEAIESHLEPEAVPESIDIHVELNDNPLTNSEEETVTEESASPIESEELITEEPILEETPLETIDSAEKIEPETEENDRTSEQESKDFFSWLKKPQHQETGDSELKTIQKQPPAKEKVDSIIEKFISTNPQISRPKKAFFSAEDMAKRSEVPDLEFVTETLANIYYEQGDYSLAIEAYQKLSLQNPSKQAYFANLIEKIKKERK